MKMSYETQNVSIPKSPDVVTVLWSRNPLQQRAPRTIVDSAVIGSADPCNRSLRNGQKFVCAEDCLLDNGFKKVFEEKLGSVFGLAVFVRQS
jgi:hypothetical protein